MFIYCADFKEFNKFNSKTLSELKLSIFKKMANKRLKLLGPVFEQEYGHYLVSLIISLYGQNESEKVEFEDKITCLVFLHVFDEVSFEENIKRMKTKFLEGRDYINKLALIVTENIEKKRKNSIYDNKFLTANTKIQSEEVLRLIEDETKEEQEILAIITAKEKEEKRKLNESLLSENQNHKTSEDSETNEPKIKGKNNKRLIFITLAATCVLLLFFLIKYLSSKGKNES